MAEQQTQQVQTESKFSLFLKSFAKGFPKFINKLVQFSGIILALGVIMFSVMTLYQVTLENKVVRDVHGPVSRFIANVDFDKREVKFDSTFSKTTDSPAKIAIWRMGDGKVLKSATPETIFENETLTYTFPAPGQYSIGYSIIDGNDFSDEATCVITFKDSGTPLRWANSVSTNCGKSTTSYNDYNSEFRINYTRNEIRNALSGLGAAVLLLGGVAVFAAVFKKYFEA